METFCSKFGVNFRKIVSLKNDKWKLDDDFWKRGEKWSNSKILQNVFGIVYFKKAKVGDHVFSW